MPRGRVGALAPKTRLNVTRTPPALLTRRTNPTKPKDGPRLWNAKRRIRTSIGIPFTSAQAAVRRPTSGCTQKFTDRWSDALKSVSNRWWELDGENLRMFMNEHPQISKVSEDVKDFIIKSSDRNRSHILRLLSRPSEYFSLARNVPDTQRKQVFLYINHHRPSTTCH
jgi:hypothetical protein